MENNDDKMEGLQNVSQPKSPVEIEVVEAVRESTGTEETPGSTRQEESAGDFRDFWAEVWRRAKECWTKALDFLKRRRRLAYGIGLAVVAVAVVLIVLLTGNRKDKNRYESLGQTITEMKRISEFCTANYIGEVMIKDEEKQFIGRKNIVLIVRGKVRMGYDLSKMEVEMVDDTIVNLALPTAQVLDIVTNPSDIRTFSEKGSWSHERVTLAKNAARAKLLELAMAEHMLETAKENGVRQLTAMFTAFGFKRVNIEFVADTAGGDAAAIVGDSVSTHATTLFAH